MNIETPILTEKDLKKIALEFVTVSQKAAVASYPWIGRKQKNEADGAGTEAMRSQMNTIDMNAKIVIGEGEMDEAPMLYIGEELGSGRGPYLDIAVDPVEGTTPMSKGQENSLTVIAGGPRGSLLHAPDMYMRKMAVGPKAKGYIDLNKSLTDNMHSVAKALGKEVKELTVMIQDRPRHEELINEVLNLGARIKLFHDVDIPGAIATAFDRYEIDMLVGIGGAPEGVIAATALKCLGGDFQGQLIPYNEEEKERCKKMGIDHPGKVFALNEIVQSDKCFFVATGITDGLLLNGIKKTSARFESHSIITVGGDNRFFQFIKSNY